MATDATFDNQLQALATATANFANGKDAAVKNTIIIALGGSTQSGGSTADITLTVDKSKYTNAEVQISDATIDGGVRITISDGNYIGYIDVTAQ